MRHLAFIVLIVCFFSSPSSAETKVAFSLSGGVSLGSYEGGVFHRLIEKDRSSLRPRTKVIFGASAGSINGLFGLMDLCGFEEQKKEESLLWKMWIPNGLNQLESTDKKNTALLDRKTIVPLFDIVRKKWNEGLHTDCDIIFGAAVTRKRPFVTEYQPGLDVIRQPEFFSVRIKGRGRGLPPTVENYQISRADQYRTYLPVGSSPEKDVEVLLDLIQASSAFPGAFSPYPIKFCFFKPGEVYSGCTRKNAREELFIDGGIYHNGPVGYAYDVLDDQKSKDFAVYYLNASAPVLPAAKIEEESREQQGVVRDFYNLMVDFTVQARKYELSKSLESKPNLAKHIKTNGKKYPLVSEPLYAFLGFAEKDFRISDFYLGMNDADIMEPGPIPTGDKGFLCFKDHLEGDKACPIDENLDILADLANFRKGRSFGDKSDFDVVFDFLQKKKFEFKDLGLKKKQSEFGKVYFKERLNKMLNHMVKNQPEHENSRLKYITRPALNFLHYSPPKSYYTAMLGSSLEAGYSKIVPTNNFSVHSFRKTYTLMFNGFSSFFNRSDDIWALTPMIGIEYEPVALNTAVMQWHLGGRIGYIMSPRDKLGTEECDADLAEDSSAACSGGVIHFTAALTLFEMLRTQFVILPFITNQLAFKESPELILQIGFQFN